MQNDALGQLDTCTTVTVKNVASPSCDSPLLNREHINADPLPLIWKIVGIMFLRIKFVRCAMMESRIPIMHLETASYSSEKELSWIKLSIFFTKGVVMHEKSRSIWLLLKMSFLSATMQGV